MNVIIFLWKKSLKYFIFVHEKFTFFYGKSIMIKRRNNYELMLSHFLYFIITFQFFIPTLKALTAMHTWAVTQLVSYKSRLIADWLASGANHSRMHSLASLTWRCYYPRKLKPLECKIFFPLYYRVRLFPPYLTFLWL